MLAQTRDGYTAFQLAAHENHVETLKRRFETQLIPNDLKNKSLLTRDNDGYMAWYDAAMSLILKVLETLWNWAKNALTF